MINIHHILIYLHKNVSELQVGCCAQYVRRSKMNGK